MHGRRYCYYLTPNMLTPDGYLPVIVIEGVPGTTPPSGERSTVVVGRRPRRCPQTSGQANTLLGPAQHDVRSIVLSSMTAAWKGGSSERTDDEVGRAV